MSEAIGIVFPAFLFLLQGYCLQYFYGNFLEARKFPGKWSGVLAAGVYITARTALSFLEFAGNGDYRTAVRKLILSLLILGGIAVCFYRAFRLLTFFLVVTFQAVADIGRYTTVILVGEIGDGLLEFWSWCAGRGMFSSGRILGAAINGGLAAGWLLEYAAMALLLYLPLRKIVGDFREKEYEINRTELLFLLTPAAVGLTLCMLLRIIMVTVEDGVSRLVYDRYPILRVLLPAVLLLSLLSILQGSKLFQDMIFRNRERSGRIILEKQVESLKGHMVEMERVYSGLRSMKHDMKNTLAVMGRLLEGGAAGENKELQTYLEEWNRDFEKLELKFQTGNPVADTLLNMKYHEAKREIPGITLDADRLLFPRELEILSYDLGIILGNALDNAIEACGRLIEREPEAEAFIRLSSWMKGKLLILKVENSFDGKLSGMGTKRLLPTNKTDKNAHGIGLSNIRCTAEKYGGTMDYKAVGRVFILSVMMKNERGNGNGA